MLVETLRLYDSCMLDMIACAISDAVPNFTPQVLFATPQRRYLDYLSGKTIENENLALPRIILSRGDDRMDQERQSAARVSGIQVDGEFYRSQYPTPIEIDYQIDIWTQHQWQMNYYRRRIAMYLWNLPPRYLRANVGSWWGYKWIEVYSETGTNTSELEPGGELRTIRYTYPLTVKANLFPLFDAKYLILDELFYEKAYQILSIRLDYYDWDGDLLCIDSIPRSN